MSTNTQDEGTTSTENGQNLGEMTLFEHLAELRARLLYMVIYLVIGTCVTFSFSKISFDILAAPYFHYFPENSLIGTGPAEAFLLKLKVAFFVAILITSPLLFHQIWLFLKPGLYQHERRLVLPFVAITSGLFLFGTWLCYQMILPVTFDFFYSQYESIGVTPQIRITEHLSLTIQLLLGFGIAFETPVLTYFLARGGLVTGQLLWSWSSYAILGVFILAGVLTPTGDIMTQTLFAIPLLFLYGVSIGVAYWAAPSPPPTSESEPINDVTT